MQTKTVILSYFSIVFGVNYNVMLRKIKISLKTFANKAPFQSRELNRTKSSLTYAKYNEENFN